MYGVLGGLRCMKLAFGMPMILPPRKKKLNLDMKADGVLHARLGVHGHGGP